MSETVQERVITMDFAKPEEKGISSRNIKRYVELLENEGLSTHNLIIGVGDSVVYENYWKPFDENFMHRMYSVSKSFVAIAVGFLEQDGLIDLDDSMEKYFPKELEGQTDENMRKQTIRNMLMMSTAKLERYWFSYDMNDRVKFYFENDTVQSRPGGTIFQYDSTGSFILGALVERLTGMELTEYLRVKLFDKIGVSEDLYCLKCPGGHSWGDSAIICTPRDLLLVARFVMNYGEWNGERILNEKYLRDATSRLIDNDETGSIDYSSCGYGYYIWKHRGNSFAFYGMGCQFALCFPEKNLIMIYNGDNQGKETAKSIVLDGFYRLIAETISDEPLAEDRAGFDELCEYSSGLKLAVSRGEKTSPTAAQVNGKWFDMCENPMQIEGFRLIFKDNGGVFEYRKDGELKKISFGICENTGGIFPEEGYSDEIGGKYAPGNFYKYLASGSWIEEKKLDIKVHIVDKYLAQLKIVIGFKDNEAGVYMKSFAENFLKEYSGYGTAVSDDLR